MAFPMTLKSGLIIGLKMGIGYFASLQSASWRPSLPLAAGDVKRCCSAKLCVRLFWKMGLATPHPCSLLRDTHPFRSPRGHFQSLKVSAPLFVVVHLRLWTSSHGYAQQKKPCYCKAFKLWVEDGASILYLKTFLQVFTDHFSQYFITYGLSVVTENIALYLRR